MINPKDIEKLEDKKRKKELDPEFVAEFEDGKGDDEDE